MARRSIIALALMGLAACDIPTEPPKWDQTWVVPAEEITVSVAELLPGSVSMSADSTAFEAQVPDTSFTYTLAELCSVCTFDTGTPVPKPEFHDTLVTVVGLPGDLVSATLAGGSLDVLLAHDLSFDPLRPSADPTAPTGYLVVRVTSLENLVAYDSIDGADQGFPAGTTLAPDLPIQPVQVADSLLMAIEVYSPAGDSTEINGSDTVGITVAPSTVLASELTVSATSIAIEPVATTMNFAGVSATLVERIQRGALLFDVANPFAVSGSLDVTFRGDFPAIRKTLPVLEGTYADSLPFTGAELQSILGGGTVDAVATGEVSADGGTVTLRPDQRLELDSAFELVVLIGPTEDQ